MQVWYGTEQIPADLGPTVVTLGIFDGVHRGHRTILARAVAEGRRRALPAVAVTFDPHPAQIHRPDEGLVMVSSLADRLERLASTGLTGAVVQLYSLDFAQASPEEFIREYLVGRLGAVSIVVGEDVRFGRGNVGDGDAMCAICAPLGVDVTVVHDIAHAASGRRWSSTWVREALAAGDVETAAEILGRPHRVRGVVVHGEKRGRQLGYPTANLDADDLGLVPADGVYAGWLLRGPRRQTGEHDDETAPRLPAAISVGTNPTFDGRQRTVEAHVLGRTDLDLYGEEVVVELVTRLRPMVAFDGIEPLLTQMRRDIVDTARVLGVDTPPAPEPPRAL